MEFVPGSRERVSLRDVLFIIFTKFHVLVGIFVLIVMVTAGVGFFSDPVYYVSGSVLVKPVLESNVKLQAPTPSFLSVNPVSQQDINSETKIIKSQELLREVVREMNLYQETAPKNILSRTIRAFVKKIRSTLIRLGISSEISIEEKAVKRLQDKLKIEPGTISNVIDVSLSGSSPEKIAATLNTLLKKYIDSHIELYSPKVGKDFFSEQGALYARKLDKAEKKLKAFKRQWSVIDIAAQNEADVKLLGILRQNLAMTQANIIERRTKLLAQKKNLSENGEIETFTEEYRNDLLTEYVKVLAPLLTERARIASNYTDSSTKYKTINLQIDQIRENLNTLRERIFKGSELDLNALLGFESTLKKEIAAVEQRAVLLSQKEIDLAHLIRDVRQNEKNYILYLEKTEEARIEEQKQAAKVSNVSVINWAQKPTIPVFPKKGLMILLSVAVGLFLGVGGAFAAYYLDHTIKTPENLARYSERPVLTTVEWVPPVRRRDPGNKLPRFWMADHQNHKKLLSSFQDLKHNILNVNRSADLKTIAFSGTDAGAGTSTLSYNLAMVLSWDLLDRKILLVDANIDRPSLHKVFDLPAAPGLLDVLTGNVDLSEITRTSAVRSNLDLITIGRLDHEVISPFDLDQFSRFLEKVESLYDYILFDSAPALQSSHSRVLSGKVSGTIIVAAANQTRFEVASKLFRQMNYDGTKVVGGILNKRLWAIPRAIYRRI